MTRLERQFNDAVYRLMRAIWRRLVFSYLRMEVRGAERIPREGPAIVAGNHPSVIDGVLLMVTTRRYVRFLIAEDMYLHPMLHWLFRIFGCIPVYRTKTHNGDALRGAVEALERGEVLGIFPEGTTSYQGRVPEIRPGTAIMALRTGVPVIPLAIIGSGEAYPDGCKIPRPLPVRMLFGQAEAYPRTTAQPIPQGQLNATREAVRRQILHTMALQAAAPAPEPSRPRWLKELEVAASSVIVWPLCHVLATTANPSLDPVKHQQATG